jgi:hypothetical protein
MYQSKPDQSPNNRARLLSFRSLIYPAGAHIFLWLGMFILFGILYISQRKTLEHGAPYENWDEVFTYNNAGELMTNRVPGKPYAVYGMMDSAKMVAARWYQERHEPDEYGTYSNNEIGSWSKLTAATGYRRGIPDRRAFLIARELNLAGIYLLAVACAFFAFKIYGAHGHGIVLALLLLMTTPMYLEQSKFALPNGTNALLAFLILLLCSAAVLRNRWRWLIIASGLTAVGINHKIDFLILGVLPAATLMGLLLITREQSNRSLAKRVLLTGLVFGGTLIITSPVSPLIEWGYQLNSTVGGLTAMAPNRSENFTKAKLSMLANLNFISPKSPTSTPFSVLGLVVLLALTALGPLAIRDRPWIVRTTIAAIGIVTIAVLFSIPVMRASVFYDRYLLNGISVLHAGAGVGLMAAVVYARNRTLRRSSYVLFTALLLVAVTRNIIISNEARRGSGQLDKITHLDASYTRNRAVLNAIANSGFSKTILIDQHAYFDLRALKQAGMQPRWINLDDYQQVIASLPPGRYLVLYATGDYIIEPTWMGHWPQELRTKYDGYMAFMKALPVEHDYPGEKMKLLDWRPPQSNDWITLARLEK